MNTLTSVREGFPYRVTEASHLRVLEVGQRIFPKRREIDRRCVVVARARKGVFLPLESFASRVEGCSLMIGMF